MWLIVGNVVMAALMAAMFVAPLLLYRSQVLPYLARRGAHPLAYVLGALPAVGALVIGAWLVASYVFPLPAPNAAIVIGALFLAFVFSTTTGGPAVWLTSGLGGSRYRPALAHVSDGVDLAEAALARRDLHAALDALRQAGRVRLEATADIVDAIRSALPVAETGGLTTLEVVLARVRAVEGRLWRHEARGARRVVGLFAVGAFLGLAIPSGVQSVVLARACIDVEGLLPTVPAGVVDRVPPITEALLPAPEPGSVLLVSQAVDLEAAAASRHDPDARRHLVDAGFRRGVVREWEASDGRRIHADVFEFGDAAGALRFQAVTNRYACGFANEAFGTLRQGIGLQVRWSTGDPIEEQVSWVSGNRRYVVSVSHRAPPTDHSRILEIAERAISFLNE